MRIPQDTLEAMPSQDFFVDLERVYFRHQHGTIMVCFLFKQENTGREWVLELNDGSLEEVARV